MGYPVWDPSASRGQKLTGTRRESREGLVRDDIRDPCGNRLGVLAGVCLSIRQRSVSSCKETIKQLQQETPHFIGPDLCPPNSPDPNLVDYKVWGVMQQRVYKCHMNSVDVWNSLQQNVIDAAINEWRKQLRACVHADGQHFEHLL